MCYPVLAILLNLKNGEEPMYQVGVIRQMLQGILQKANTSIMSSSSSFAVRCNTWLPDIILPLVCKRNMPCDFMGGLHLVDKICIGQMCPCVR